MFNKSYKDNNEKSFVYFYFCKLTLNSTYIIIFNMYFNMHVSLNSFGKLAQNILARVQGGTPG